MFLRKITPKKKMDFKLEILLHNVKILKHQVMVGLSKFPSNLNIIKCILLDPNNLKTDEILNIIERQKEKKTWLLEKRSHFHSQIKSNSNLQNVTLLNSRNACIPLLNCFLCKYWEKKSKIHPPYPKPEVFLWGFCIVVTVGWESCLLAS